jgi:hypothetical protein
MTPESCVILNSAHGGVKRLALSALTIRHGSGGRTVRRKPSMRFLTSGRSIRAGGAGCGNWPRVPAPAVSQSDVSSSLAEL